MVAVPTRKIHLPVGAGQGTEAVAPHLAAPGGFLRADFLGFWAAAL